MIKKEIMYNDVTIIMEKVGYGQYILRCDSPNHPPVHCTESWIFDDIDDIECSERQQAAISAALSRLDF